MGIVMLRNILFLVSVFVLSACASGGSSKSPENSQERVFNQDITTPPSLLDDFVVLENDEAPVNEGLVNEKEAVEDSTDEVLGNEVSGDQDEEIGEVKEESEVQGEVEEQ